MRFRLLSLLFAVLAPAYLLSGCGSTAGVGSTSGSFVSTTIKDTNRAAVDSAVLSVFTGDGFDLINQTRSSFTFRKWGGKSTQVVYGDWFGDGVAVTPEVIVANTAPGTYRVTCNVTMMERDIFGQMEEKWSPFIIGKAAYSGLLRKVKGRAQGAGQAR